MNRSYLNFPVRLCICLILLMLILFWQFGFDLGAYYYQQGRTEQYRNDNNQLALLNYQLSLRYKPDDPQSLYHYGIVLMNSGQIDEAIISLQTAYDLGYEPFWRTLVPLILMLEATGQEEEAAAYQATLEAERQQ